MKSLLLFCFAFLLLTTNSHAQSTAKPKLNAISLEVGKNGLIYHLNFDHRFNNSKLGFRVGAGSNFAQYLKATVVGGGLYYLAGKQAHFLELGMDVQWLVVDVISDDQKGLALVYPGRDVNTMYPSVNIGYRHYAKNTLFRIGVSPGIIESKMVPGGYISFGIRF